MNSLYDLFLLLFTLSQMHDREKIISLFQESLEELFYPYDFTFSVTKKEGATYSEAVSTTHYSFGYISSFNEPAIEVKQLLQNAIQMLAVILERLQFESELKKRTETLEDVDKQRLIEIQDYVKELEKSKLDSLNLIEELKVEIQERRLTEKALNESNLLIQNIIDNSHSLIYLTDLEARFILANQELEVLFGLKKDEIIGKTRDEIMPKELAEQHRNNDLLVIQTKQINTFEEEHDQANGKHYFLTQKFPLFDSTGNVYAVGGISTDITDRKIAEEKLKRSEHDLTEAERIGKTGSWNYEVATDSASWSANMFRIFDVDPEMPTELVFKHFIENLVHPDDRKHIRSVSADALSGKRPYELEYRTIKKDGSFINIYAIAETLRDENGKITRMIGKVEDITERKKAEEEIVRLSRVYMVLGNVNKAIVHTREKHELFDKICQIAVDDGNFLMSWFGMVNPQTNKVDVVASYGKSDGYLDNLNIDLGDEVLSYGPTGRSIIKGKSVSSNDIANDKNMIPWCENALKRGYRSSIALPLKISGKVTGALTLYSDEVGYFNDLEIDLLDKLAMDISYALEFFDVEAERKHSEEEVFMLNKMLEQRVIERTVQLENANKELESFSYSVSHDLRAPLRGIDGFSLALLEDYHDNLDETGRDYIDRIRAATLKMDRLIDSLLRLSRISRLEMNFEEVNLSFIVKEIANSLTETNSSRNVCFVIPENIITFGDLNLLKIVFDNLLSNAWKFTSRNDKTVIEFGAFNENSKNVYFIRDNGVGFDMKYVDKLFSAFQRLHSEKEYPGVGVGLSTVQRIIRRHNGDIWAKSQLNKGTTFYFTL